MSERAVLDTLNLSLEGNTVTSGHVAEERYRSMANTDDKLNHPDTIEPAIQPDRPDPVFIRPYPKFRPDGIPRRCDIMLRHPVERSLADANRLVEELGADPRLTAASIKIQEAKDLVADWLESE